MVELDINRVISLFSIFSDLEGEALDKWHGLCEASSRAIGIRVRHDVGAFACMEELCTAAAGLAYSDFLTVQSVSGQNDEVRVGDITLRSSTSTGGKNTDAKEIKAHFLSGVAHLLEPECPALILTGGGK